MTDEMSLGLRGKRVKGKKMGAFGLRWSPVSFQQLPSGGAAAFPRAGVAGPKYGEAGGNTIPSVDELGTGMIRVTVL